MKKLVLCLFAMACMFNAKAQIVSINPDSGLRNQTLTTTITMSSGLMLNASAPWSSNDIYLQQGGTTIFASSFNWPSYFDFGLMRMVYADSGEATFTIPANAPNGYYDVNINIYPFASPVLYTMYNGFFVGSPAGTVSGKIYFDQDQDGNFDAGELPVSNQMIRISPGNNIALTNYAGEYTYYADSGTYLFEYLPSANFIQTSVPLNYTETIPPSVNGRDFGTYSNANLYSNKINIIQNWFRCNQHVPLLIQIRNDGFLPVEHHVTLSTSNFQFVSSTIPPDDSTAVSYSWVISNLSGGQMSYLGGGLIYHAPSAGSVVYVHVSDSIFDSSNNFLTVIYDSYSTQVRCSFDPNDKHASPEGLQSQHFTPINSPLLYHINFQNTGNDTAYDVFILDTLDANLDLSTFEVIASSHTMTTQMTATGAVRFNFFNIMLPDSGADEPASHGWVEYRISPNAGLPDPTVITNTSHIIFDQNVPVVTNTTMNTMTALQYPQASFITDDQSICETNCIQFVNQSVSGTSYSWIFAGGNPATSTAASPGTICYPTAGNYDVTLITTNALGSDTLLQPAFISVATSPGVFTVTQSGDSLIAPQGYDSYQWFYNNSPIIDDTLYYHVATQNGDYSVVVENVNGCQSGVNIPNFIIGVEDVYTSQTFEVYPNPTNGEFEIMFESKFAQDVLISIYDNIGHLVYSEKIISEPNSDKISVSNSLASGVYTLKVVSEKGIGTKRLMVNK